MSMSKKHFIALAEAIRLHQQAARQQQANLFEDDQLQMLERWMRSENSNFNQVRWRGYVEGRCGPNGGEVAAAREQISDLVKAIRKVRTARSSGGGDKNKEHK